MDRSSAAVPISSSVKSKTLAEPLTPSTAGKITTLISSISPARRKAAFVTPPPLTSSRLIPSSRLEDVERKCEIELAAAGDDVRDLILPKAGEVGVADLLGQ